MHRYNWDDVRYLLALIRGGGLSAAARQLGVEHSTVARRIDALEQDLGLRLFERLPRRWQLTAEGEALTAMARRMEDEALALQRVAAGTAPLTGSVRVSAPPALASHWLLPRLRGLRQRLPGITLELIAETREANLNRHEADLALRLQRPRARGLATRPLAELRYALYAAHDYPWLEQPERWEFVGYDESLAAAPQQQWLQALAGARPFALRANDLGVVLQALRAGLGVGVLPQFLAAEAPELRRIDSPSCPLTRGLWLVLHPDLKRAPRVRAVADELIRALGSL